MAALVDRLPAGPPGQVEPLDRDVELAEHEPLGLVEEQEFLEPVHQEPLEVVRRHADLHLASGLHGLEADDQAEHPRRRVLEQLLQGCAVCADADIRGMVELLVAHGRQR